jgi:hypothetical protein
MPAEPSLERRLVLVTPALAPGTTRTMTTDRRTAVVFAVGTSKSDLRVNQFGWLRPHDNRAFTAARTTIGHPVAQKSMASP